MTNFDVKSINQKVSTILTDGFAVTGTVVCVDPDSITIDDGTTALRIPRRLISIVLTIHQ